VRSQVAIIGHEDSVETKALKKASVTKRKQQWSDKWMHESTYKEKTCGWAARSNLKITTKALIFAVQEQAIRTNYLKFHIDKSTDSPSCRMCGEKGETIS